MGHRQVREDEYGNRLLVAAVRDPIDHFLSGWAECGARDKLLKADINGTYDERVFAWLNVARSYTWGATCVGHSLPQANFLLLRMNRRRKQGKSYFHPRVDLVGDMHELPQLLELAGFRYNETIETPNMPPPHKKRAGGNVTNPSCRIGPSMLCASFLPWTTMCSTFDHRQDVSISLKGILYRSTTSHLGLAVK